jgi:hypothetical protein
MDPKYAALIEEVTAIISETEPLIEAKAKLGSGARFRALVKNIKSGERHKGRKKIRNVGAVAAAAGRKKYGSKRMAAMAAAGRRRG